MKYSTTTTQLEYSYWSTFLCTHTHKKYSNTTIELEYSYSYSSTFFCTHEKILDHNYIVGVLILVLKYIFLYSTTRLLWDTRLSAWVVSYSQFIREGHCSVCRSTKTRHDVRYVVKCRSLYRAITYYQGCDLTKVKHPDKWVAGRGSPFGLENVAAKAIFFRFVDL